jgi:hypothetical protein
MLRGANRHAPYARAARLARTVQRASAARRLPALLALLCGVFALQSLPTAAAAKGSAGSTIAGAPVEATAQSVRRAERAAAKAEVVPPVAPAPPVQVPPTPVNAHERHEERRQQRQEARAQSAAPTSGPAAVTNAETSAATGAEALAERQKKGSGGGGKKERKEKAKEKAKEKTKEKTKGKGKETGGGATGEEAEDPTEGGSESASLKGKAASLANPAAPAASASVSAALATPTPTLGTGSASIVAAAPASSTTAGTDLRAGHGHHRRASSELTGAALQPIAASSGSSSRPLAAQPDSARRTAPHKAAKRSHESSSQPALVKTFTKIVGVVPTPIRILIVALIAIALLLGARSLFSGVRTRRLVRQRGQLLEDVGVLQAALLPVPPSRLGPVATSVAYRPADGPGAGGDFYDVFALEDGQLAVIVGDVSGHGREALPHTALVRFTVRAYLEAGLSPRKALQTAGSVLDRQLGGSFATVVVATYHPRERRLTYASAGHPPPVVLAESTEAGAHGEAEGLKRTAVAPVTACSAPPVGAGMRTGTRQTVVSIPGPARLCFHTDGVTEARIEGDLFGAERLTAVLSTLAPQADASALLDQVAEQSDVRPDDMAACLLRVLDGQGAPSIALEQLELDREAVRSPRVERFLSDCGVSRKQAQAVLRDARERLQREETVLLELSSSTDGPVLTLLQDNVIQATALAIASAS